MPDAVSGPPGAPKTIKSKKSVASVKYTGVLATPLTEVSTLIAFYGEDGQQYYDLLWSANLKTLFEWYSIDPAATDAWKRLAIGLARDHVPGMSARPAPKKRGRPHSWEDGLYVKLLRAVEDLRDKNQRMTVAKAIQTLLECDEWHQYTQESLEVRYREARRLEEDHRRRYREWKENPERFHIGLLKAFAIDLDKDFEQLRSEGFKIDEN